MLYYNVLLTIFSGIPFINRKDIIKVLSSKVHSMYIKAFIRLKFLILKISICLCFVSACLQIFFGL